MTKEPTLVYNFQVEDFHTYFIGENEIWVHNADCVIHPSGEIEITDWDGYPEGAPKPEGKLKLLEGDEYALARRQTNAANRKYHRQHPEFRGKDIHEIHPVKFGGSPTDVRNKIPLSRSEHTPFTKFWETIKHQVLKQR